METVALLNWRICTDLERTEFHHQASIENFNCWNLAYHAMNLKICKNRRSTLAFLKATFNRSLIDCYSGTDWTLGLIISCRRVSGKGQFLRAMETNGRKKSTPIFRKCLIRFNAFKRKHGSPTWTRNRDLRINSKKNLVFLCVDAN